MKNKTRKMRSLTALAIALVMVISLLGGISFAPVTAYALPPTSTYKVTYDANGATSGSVPIDSNSYNKNDSVEVCRNTGNLEKTGYIFAGWNSQSDGAGTDYGISFIITDNTTLYAKWTVNAATLDPVSYMAWDIKREIRMKRVPRFTILTMLR